MKKEDLKRMLKTVGIASCITGAALMSTGCSDGGKTSCGDKKSGSEESQTSCGKGSCSKMEKADSSSTSCGKGAESKEEKSGEAETSCGKGSDSKE
ncbi:MAG: hypothetical protein ACLFQK_07870 [Fibrobacterota bacterium]